MLSEPEFSGGESRQFGALPIPNWESLTYEQNLEQVQSLSGIYPGTQWGVYGNTPETPLVPVSQWRDVDLSPYFPPIKDQNGRNACCAFQTITIAEATRKMCGLPHVDLSTGDLYSRINNGVDQGALPQRALAEMMGRGVAPASLVPMLHWFGEHKSPQVVGSRASYKIGEAWWCPTPDHAASAIMRGFVLAVSVFWRGNEGVDGNGWLQNTGGGGINWGGHAVAGCGLSRRNGVWGFPFRNSWSENWGVRGSGVVPWERAVIGCRAFRWWAIRGITQEQTNLPEPKVTDETIAV